MIQAAVSSPSAAARSPVLVGVDVVESARITDLLGRYAAAAVKRVCTQPEIDWVGPITDPAAADRLAAVFALKEAAIKAMTGRPAGFRWQSLQSRVRPPSVIPVEVATLMGDFADDLGMGPAVTTGFRVEGGSALRLAGLLPGTGLVCGAGRYVTQDGHVLATVCFWRAMGSDR